MIKKATIIKISLGITIFIIFVTIILFIFNHSQNTNNVAIKINNFSQYYPTITTDRLSESVSDRLTTLLKINSSTNEYPNDVTIRNNAPIIYNYNHQNSSYSGNFIIDIPSLEQSYRVSFFLPLDPETINLNPVEVTCLSSTEIIYPNFQCKNMGQH